MDWRRMGGWRGFGAELTLKSSWEIRLIHLADLVAQREKRTNPGRLSEDSKITTLTTHYRAPGCLKTSEQSQFESKLESL